MKRSGLLTHTIFLLCAVVAFSAFAGAVNQPVPYEIRGQYGGRCTGVAVQGDYAYVIEGRTLVVLDVTNTAAPRETCRINLGTLPIDIHVSGTRLAINTSKEYQIFDISQPARPVLQGVFTAAIASSATAFAGDFLYLGDYGTYEQVGSDFVFSGVSLTILDISDPTQPRQRGQLGIYGHNNVRIEGISFAHGRVYVGCSGTYSEEFNSIVVVDVSNPDAPAQIGAVKIPQNAHYDAPRAIALSGNRLYSTGYFLDTFSLDNPSSPTLLSQAPIPQNTDFIDAAPHQFLINGSRAYLLYTSTCMDGDLIRSTLQILDVSDPAHPALTYQTDPEGMAYQLATKGTALFVASNIKGLRVLDASATTTPTETARFQSLAEARAVAVSGPRAYVMEGDVMTAIDISDEAAPTPTTRTPIAGLYGRLQSAGPLLFNLNTTSGLSIIDASQADAPRLLARLKTPGEADALALEGHYAYVADGSRLSIIDLADPARPSMVAFSGAAPEPLKRFTGVAVQYGTAYLGDEDNGLAIYDVSQPASPKLVKRLAVTNMKGWADVALWQNRVLLGANSQWAIIDVNNLQFPQLLRGLTNTGLAQATPTYALVTDGGVVYQYPLRAGNHPSLGGTDLLTMNNYALFLGSPTWHSSVVRDFKAAGRTGFVAFGSDGFYILHSANLYNAASPAWLSVP